MKQTLNYGAKKFAQILATRSDKQLLREYRAFDPDEIKYYRQRRAELSELLDKAVKGSMVKCSYTDVCFAHAKNGVCAAHDDPQNNLYETDFQFTLEYSDTDSADYYYVPLDISDEDALTLINSIINLRLEFMIESVKAHLAKHTSARQIQRGSRKFEPNEDSYEINAHTKRACEIENYLKEQIRTLYPDRNIDVIVGFSCIQIDDDDTRNGYYENGFQIIVNHDSHFSDYRDIVEMTDEEALGIVKTLINSNN
jgi:hypothetical protein